MGDLLPVLYRWRGYVMDWLRSARYSIMPSRPPLLEGARGIIHVGANLGQERFQYGALGIRVLWIEPIPEVYARLCANVARYGNQRAVNALITDRDDDWRELHVTNNDGASSSIMRLARHRDIWPHVRQVRSVRVQGTTLPTLLARIGEDVARYDVLAIDTQGSELIVLKGLGDDIRRFRRIQVEAADFEAYVGCCTVDTVSAYLQARGFRETSRKCFAVKRDVGGYFNLVFANPAC
jgi:FkbM family methyltransferase